MVRVYRRRNRLLIGILENAYNVTEQQRLNSVSAFSFTLPEDDHKNSLCEPFNYVNWDNGQWYRIMPSTHVIDELGGIIYECEHVIATLIDHVMFGHHIDGGVAGGHEGNNTTAVLRRLLSRQNQQYDPWTQTWTEGFSNPINWVLGTVEINHNFEYGWEQETILRAVWSVAAPFTEPYFWDFDTTRHPFVLHLRRLPTNPADALFIRQGKNLLKLERQSDPAMLCTRIYPLGQGEGVNQVNIRNVNNGVPFLQSPISFIERYRIIERVWIDRRYTNEVSLRDAAQAMLNELQEVYEEYSVDFERLGDADIFRPWLGRMVDVAGFKRTWITGIDYSHDDITITKLFIANKPRDIAGSIADMADRQRIEMAYAQGATTFFTESENGNAMPNAPLLMELFIPHGLHIVNFIELNVTMNRFRIDSQATEGGGAIGQSTPALRFDTGNTIDSNLTTVKRYTENSSVNNTPNLPSDQSRTPNLPENQSSTPALPLDQRNTGQFNGNTDQFNGNTTQFNGSTGQFSGNTTQFNGSTGQFSGNTENAGNANTSIGGGSVTIAGLVQTITGSSDVNNIQQFPDSSIPGPWAVVDTFAALNNTMAAQLSARNTFWRQRLNEIINAANAHAHNINLSGNIPSTQLNWQHSHTVNHGHGMTHGHAMIHDHGMTHSHIMTHDHRMIHSHSMAHTHNMQHRHDMRHWHDIRHIHDMRHRHNMDHAHRIEVPDHTHLMEPRMAFWREQPTSFQIIINGTVRQTVNSTHFNRDITDWLLDAQGRLLRGVYNRVEIRPNLPAHIRQMACVQGFVNSRGNRAL